VTDSKILEPQHLPPSVLEEMRDYGAPLKATDSDTDHSAPDEATLRELLERHQGNVAAVGRELGKARMQVHRWLKRYAISLSEFRH
jgi:transcriptional regulator of acetoin/glycerol metabolism